MSTVFQRLKGIAQDVPDQVAVHLFSGQQSEQVLTYQELTQGAAGYAQALASTAIQPGEVVILILQHGKALVYSFFGAILHGAIPSIMPFLTEKLSPDQYRQSLSALFEITQPAAVITYPEFVPEIQAAMQSGNSVQRVLVCDDIYPVKEIDWGALNGSQSQPDWIVLLQHSSGTTGLQKGVALSHQAVFNQLDSYSRALQLNGEDVIVSWLPLYHDMGLIAGFILPILCKVPLVLMSPFDWVRSPVKLLQAISKHRGTLAWLPNFAYNFCAQKIRERELDGIDLSSWRAVINCSEPMYHRSQQLFLERFLKYGLKPEALATCYAMAENVFAVTQGGIDSPVTIDTIDANAFMSEQVAIPAMGDAPTIQMVSAGRPIDQTYVRILDEKKNILPERVIGEIAICSNCMLSGYYNRPDLTEKAFHHGWYFTGDLGYLANGEVYITGRKKDQIIVGGKNIYPQDLENLASAVTAVHPGRVVAFGIPNPHTGTEDVVVVAEIGHQPSHLLDSHPPNPGEIEEEIRQLITRGSDIALRYVKVVPRGWLLKTSSGKIARNSNRQKYLNEFGGRSVD
jgi:acyl-CoA synthetase (AMP-forming)/AMP-acid ligase II